MTIPKERQLIKELNNWRKEYHKLEAEVEELHWLSGELADTVVDLNVENQKLQEALADAVKWNWLDSDAPVDLLVKYEDLAGIRPEGE